MLKIYLRELLINPLNNIFICLGLVISIYCLSIGTSFFYVQFNFYDDINNFWRENLSIQLEFKQDTNLEYIINKIDKLETKSGIVSPEYHIYLGERVYSLTGIYKYGNLNKVYPVIEGRYLTKEETKGNKKVALVGSNIKDLTYIKNNIRYMDIQGESFKVVGIIGRDTMSYWGTHVIVPMKSLPKETYRAKSKVIELCYYKNMLNEKGYFNDLKKQLNEKEVINVNLVNKKPSNIFTKVYDKDKPTYISLGFSIALSLVTILIFSTFWANDLKRNIVIKRILGASNFDIIKMLFFQISIVMSIAIIISVALNTLTLKLLETIFLTSVKINILNILIISIFALIIIILNLFWIYRNIFKFKISEDIK
ncbi:ABC transporter permease [Clostridium botulinum]|uniref:ABC transporter permease n=1 Tax=Clostridium botulinum TaxID=1491 RepID=A0A6G4EEX6_CLOBO|nr:ABC transporter permease [Clostridium botulinum]APH19672.1 ftsX-like permease family protein [Clostridium botulinum]AUM91295.1 hypothetical protein RSJ5_08400 [Clostridium botulinum]NFB13866.1 ABC transporter permease [Clostridium botulinum]NFH58145.1 ABC transporter permease [Clostridium botulinum]NFH61735.1 ABC transporter permease [Clostridium botulinum]